MYEAFAKVSTPILIFILGYVLKKAKVLKKDDGDAFLRLVFYIVIPSLYIVSIPSLKLVPSLFYLPLVVPLVVFATFILSFLVGKALRLQKISFGVFLISTMIMNTGFLLPFFLAVYGNSGLARLSLLDATNGIVTFSFIYFIACRYGEGERSTRLIIEKVLLAPPIWATLIGFGLNVTVTQLPLIAVNFFQTIGNLATPLIMLALGSYFTLNVSKFSAAIPALLIRFGFGLLLGFGLASLFHLDGLTRIIVIISAGAPIGYNTITFSSLERLDIEYATSIISLSMLLSIVIIPLLLLLVR